MKKALVIFVALAGLLAADLAGAEKYKRRQLSTVFGLDPVERNYCDKLTEDSEEHIVKTTQDLKIATEGAKLLAQNASPSRWAPRILPAGSEVAQNKTTGYLTRICSCGNPFVDLQTRKPIWAPPPGPTGPIQTKKSESESTARSDYVEERLVKKESTEDAWAHELASRVARGEELPPLHFVKDYFDDDGPRCVTGWSVLSVAGGTASTVIGFFPVAWPALVLTVPTTGVGIYKTEKQIEAGEIDRACARTQQGLGLAGVLFGLGKSIADHVGGGSPPAQTASGRPGSLAPNTTGSGGLGAP